MMKISLPLRVHCVAVGLAVSSVFGADPCHYPAEIQIMCQGKGCSGNITVHFCSEPGGSPKRCSPQGYQSCCAAQIPDYGEGIDCELLLSGCSASASGSTGAKLERSKSAETSQPNATDQQAIGQQPVLRSAGASAVVG